MKSAQLRAPPLPMSRKLGGGKELPALPPMKLVKERAEARRTGGTPPRQGRQEQEARQDLEFEKYHAQGATALTKEEVGVMAAAQYGTEIDPAWLDELIGTFDKDQSGMIELCEFRELFQVLEEEAKPLVAPPRKAQGGAGADAASMAATLSSVGPPLPTVATEQPVDATAGMNADLPGPASDSNDPSEGVPACVMYSNILIAALVCIGAAVYIILQTTDSNGIPHDDRGPLQFLQEATVGNAEDRACLQTFDDYTRACQPEYLTTGAFAPYGVTATVTECSQAGSCHCVAVKTATCAAVSGAGSCTGTPQCTYNVSSSSCYATAEPACDGVSSLGDDSACLAVMTGNHHDCHYVMPPAPDQFVSCTDRAQCSNHGDCINSGQSCSCDSGWAGNTCAQSVGQSVNIAGVAYGTCPSGCQDKLDTMYDACIEVDWFSDMEDDVRLPKRAADIGCYLNGMSGEKKEIEATIFEDVGELPEFIKHLLITLYVCYALALICEDFFVASLDLMIEALGLSPDVAGATFMAAGSSAPELFVSAAGVFITHSPVGVGACAGSTMFNTMCIIGGSALIAGKPVPLQWRSVARDGGVYVASCIALMLLLWDGVIYTWEAGVLLGMYAGYIALCAFTPQMINCCCPRKKDQSQGGDNINDALPHREGAEELLRTSIMAKRSAAALLRGESAQRLDVLLTATVEMSKSSTNLLKSSGAHDMQTSVNVENRKRARTATQAAILQTIPDDAEMGDLDLEERSSMIASRARSRTVTQQIGEDIANLEGTAHEHGICVVPHGSSARIAWAISFPLMLMFTLTVPNCSKHPRLYVLTFVFCIVWLGLLVEIMVEHASEVGALLGFSPGILGLTLLAAGTSFPDLIASLLVAKKGSIDMAVSNAFGSNNFDILLCLGLPWFLSGIFFGPVLIDTDGIMVAIISLIVTTLIWLIYMQITNFVLTPGVGFSMLMTYGTWLICQFMFDLFSPHAHE